MRFNVGRLSEPFLFLVALVSVVVLWCARLDTVPGEAAVHGN